MTVFKLVVRTTSSQFRCLLPARCLFRRTRAERLTAAAARTTGYIIHIHSVWDNGPVAPVGLSLERSRGGGQTRAGKFEFRVSG